SGDAGMRQRGGLSFCSHRMLLFYRCYSDEQVSSPPAGSAVGRILQFQAGLLELKLRLDLLLSGFVLMNGAFQIGGGSLDSPARKVVPQVEGVPRFVQFEVPEGNRLQRLVFRYVADYGIRTWHRASQCYPCFQHPSGNSDHLDARGEARE